jgi:hypothetical protein
LNKKINPSDWEHHFTDEAIQVEELLAGGDITLLTQSKIRIAIENKILQWEKYKEWVQSEHEYPVIKSDLNPIYIEKLRSKHYENKKTFSHYNIWSEDLIAIEIWDGQIIILGLQLTDKFQEITNAIFILCPPSILNQIRIDISADDSINSKVNKNKMEDTASKNELLDIDASISAPVNLNFSSLRASSESVIKNVPTENAALKTNTVMTENIAHTHVTKTVDRNSDFQIWDSISNKHSDNSIKARKQFEAFIVLKIINDKTHVFRMDEDLAKEDLNEGLFKYDLKNDNPFSKVYKRGASESFNLAQLGLNILDFKFACISPLQLGQKVFGFLVGFKIVAPNSVDESVLDTISLENAA